MSKFMYLREIGRSIVEYLGRKVDDDTYLSRLTTGTTDILLCHLAELLADIRNLAEQQREQRQIDRVRSKQSPMADGFLRVFACGGLLLENQPGWADIGKIARDGLTRKGIRTVGQLLALSNDELYGIKGIGPTIADRILDFRETLPGYMPAVD